MPVDSLKNLLSKKTIYNAVRWELFRVLFRLLNHSIYKNDPNLGNFNLNYVSNSRKILDSVLFDRCIEFLDKEYDKNEDSFEIIGIIHLLGQCLNDLPAQIPKAIANGVVKAMLDWVEKKFPNTSNAYYEILKFVSYV